MSKIRDIILGCAVGDALGVPFEFKNRGSFKCEKMTGNGTHNQEKGTWSDDTSMTLCLADCIADDFSYTQLAFNFLAWYKKGDYTANGDVFDIGNATINALENFRNGVSVLEAGGISEYSNGNGSLMRIAPLVLYTKNMSIAERFEICKNVSSITHRHDISVSACLIYTEFLRSLINGNSLKESVEIAKETKDSLKNFDIDESVIRKFSALNYIENLKENEISSSGYVIDTLIASIWCVLKTNSYKDAVLKAVNLGDDTDTTGAVAGVIAGIIYGEKNIPEEWIETLKNKNLIFSICNKFESSIGN